MNVISLTVWTLENNCFIIYTAMIVCFIAFTMFHKNRMEAHYNRMTAKKKFAPTGGGKDLKVNDLRNLQVCNWQEVAQDRARWRKICSEAKIHCGSLRQQKRDYHNDEDDPDLLISAIPEDTPHIPYKPQMKTEAEILEKSREYYELMAKRRTVRSFSTEPIPKDVLENIVKVAGTSPSGAHTEPWTFVVVQDPETKEAIRNIVEEEEELNYAKRMSRQWVTDLKPFATKPTKPYLTDAPALILVFRQAYSFRPDGRKRMHYYSEISVAIAAGFLLAAVQYCGLVALTSTPLNCNSRLRDLLSRPVNERLELLFPVGKPHNEATVPDLQRKCLEEIMVNV